jgi:SAM-dependent methyltransferase
MLKNSDGISPDLRSRLRRLEEVSWNFDRARSRSAFSAVHFHPGRFISQLPSILISLFSDPGETILDPFCGAGTTLVEAQRLGRKSMGIDVNPISVLISRAKTLRLSETQVQKILRCYFAQFVRMRSKSLRHAAPPTVQVQKWYSPSVADDLLRLYRGMTVTRSEEAKLLKQLCFSSILMRAARETRHWGYVCDNTDPKAHPFRDIPAILEQTIEEIRVAYQERDKFDDTGPRYVPSVLLGSAERILSKVSQESVDLIVTSPPYFGVVDYVKAQRLSMEWFGYEIEPYRVAEIGARSKRHRKTAALEFERELISVFGEARRVLKAGRLCIVIFGASDTRTFRESRIVSILEAAGFELIHGVNRDVSIQRRQKPSILSERVYIFRKPLTNSLAK